MDDAEHLSGGELLHVTLRFLKPEDFKQVRELCEEWFPITYPPIWYKWITETDMFYALAALQGSTIVGLLIAQTKPLTDVNPEDQIVLQQADLNGGNIGYILTLGVRKPYRRLGLASLLLNQYIEHVRLDYYIKCQSLNCSSSYSSGDVTKESKLSEGSNGMGRALQEMSFYAPSENRPTSDLDVLENLPVNKLDGSPENRLASRDLAFPVTNSVQSEANNNPEDNCSANRNSFKVSVPSRTSHFINVSVQNDSGENPIFRSQLKRPENSCSSTNENNLESLRNGSVLQLSNEVKTSDPVVLNINVEELTPCQIMSESSSVRGRTDAADVKISICGSSNALDVKGEWSDLRPNTELKTTTTSKSFIDADINCNVLAQKNACHVPLCASGRLDATFQNQETSGADSSAVRGHRDVPGEVDGSSQSDYSGPHSDEHVPTIYSSYVVESELTRGLVLERLRCCSSLHCDAPITALLLHVLSSNAPAIAFYLRRKFTQLAFLPMYYTINDVAQDGYSYVFYLNGGEAPSSFFADPLGSLTRKSGPTLGTFGSLSSVPARAADAVTRWVLGDEGSRSNIVRSVVASMVGVLEKMVATLVGADTR